MDTTDAIWEAWCDGTAVPNPGRIGIGALLVAPTGERNELSRAPGRSGCNNEAELQAISAALELSQQAGARRLRLYSDSRFAVDCLNGRDATAITRLSGLLAQVAEHLAGFDEVTIVWLPRHRNTEADRLARAALGLAPKPTAPRSKRHR